MNDTTTPATARPIAERARVPAEYGRPKPSDRLLDWSHVEQRLTEARVYWIATSGPGGRPRVRPLDGLYVDGVIYLGGSPETRWSRDLEENPQVAIHLDDGSHVVIVEGVAELLDAGVVDPELAQRLAAASNAKYPEYGMTADSYKGPGPYAVRPQVAYGWKNFPKDVTRFRFG